MTQTTVGPDFHERPATGCWCCGDRTVRGSLLRLRDHPEVGVRFRCVRELNRRKRRIERTTRAAPPGPLWRRLQYRIGFDRC